MLAKEIINELKILSLERKKQLKKSKKILSAIKIDETKHKNTAKDYGSTELSDSAKKLMLVSSKIMKRLSFYI